MRRCEGGISLAATVVANSRRLCRVGTVTEGKKKERYDLKEKNS